MSFEHPVKVPEKILEPPDHIAKKKPLRKAKRGQRTAPTKAGVHRFVKLIFSEMNREHWTREGLAKRSGVSHDTFAKWRNGSRTPNLFHIEAVLMALGFRLKIVPLDDDEEG